MDGLHVGELADAAPVAPLREAARGVQDALRVWSLLICAVKNSRTRRAAFGVGVIRHLLVSRIIALNRSRVGVVMFQRPN